jgi:hypothetical protein
VRLGTNGSLSTIISPTARVANIPAAAFRFAAFAIAGAVIERRPATIPIPNA